MKRVILAICLMIVSAAVTSVLILRIAEERNSRHIKMLWLANLEFTAQKATDAYFTADPHAAIWAIQHSIDQHEVAGPAHLLLGTDMPLFMTVSHVRIANLCRRLGDEAGFRRHMDVALTFAEQKAKKPVREEELLETIRIFDEADRKARQPANVPDSEPVTRSPQE